MNCAECGGGLAVERHGLFEDIEVLRCGDCEAGFYAAGTVDRLDDTVTVDAEALPFQGRDASTRACPACVSSGYRERGAAPMDPLALPAPHAAPFWRCVRCRGIWMRDASLDAFRRAALAASSSGNRRLNERAGAIAHGLTRKGVVEKKGT